MAEDNITAKAPWLVTAGVFFISLSLYTVTLAPGLLWGGGDFATFQTRAYLLEIEPGIFGHPLWVVLAHPFTWLPVRDVAWRANFASAVFASLALLFVFLSAWQLTRSRLASLLATGALALSHTFWTYAVMPKVYSLNALLLVATIYLLLRWGEELQGVCLYAFALFYVISQFNHLVMATAAVGFLAYIGMVGWRHRSSASLRRQILIAALVGGLSLLAYLWFLINTRSAHSTSGTILRFLRGLGHLATSPKALGLGIGIGLALLFYQFPVTTLVGFTGLRRLWKVAPRKAWMLLLIVLGDLAFLLAAIDPRTGGDYVWNLHYYLQAYVVFALWIASGFAYLWPRWFASQKSRQIVAVLLALILPVIVYSMAPITARTVVKNVPGFRSLPGRDNFTYVLSPWKHHETGARDFGEAVLQVLPPNSVIFADYSLWAVFRYLQLVEGYRTDVTLVKLPYAGHGSQLSVILAYAPTSELFLADTWRYYDMQEIQELLDVVPWPPVYHLVPRKE